jgi:hypothetical protein
MLVGPHSTRTQQAAFAERIAANPRDYIAQPTLSLSRVPTIRLWPEWIHADPPGRALVGSWRCPRQGPRGHGLGARAAARSRSRGILEGVRAHRLGKGAGRGRSRINLLAVAEVVRERRVHVGERQIIALEWSDVDLGKRQRGGGRGRDPVVREWSG